MDPIISTFILIILKFKIIFITIMHKILPIIFTVLSWPWKFSLNLNLVVTDSKGRVILNSKRSAELDKLDLVELRKLAKTLAPSIHDIPLIDSLSLKDLRQYIKDLLTEKH